MSPLPSWSLSGLLSVQKAPHMYFSWCCLRPAARRYVPTVSLREVNGVPSGLEQFFEANTSFACAGWEDLTSR